MHTDHMLASRWTESENPSTHDPVVPGKIRSCRGSELDVTAEPSVNHTLAWAFFVCAWILFKGGVWGGEEKKFVQLINPMIKDNRIGGGGSAEMTRWLEEGRKRKTSGPTFLFSQLIFVICHPESVWPHSCVCVCVSEPCCVGALLDSFHYKWHGPGRQLHWRQGSQLCQGF